MDVKGQPIEINIEWWIFYLKYIIFYLIIISRTVAIDMEY